MRHEKRRSGFEKNRRIFQKPLFEILLLLIGQRYINKGIKKKVQPQKVQNCGGTLSFIKQRIFVRRFACFET